MMSYLSEWITAGKELGLQDEDLRKFIQDQEDKEGKRKQEELQERKRQEEREEKRRQEDIAREERAAERDLKKLEYERDIALAQRQQRESRTERASAKAPKLPLFNESQDDIDAYIERFERYADAQHWRREEWATNLSALLSGKALDVYYRMPKEQSTDYEKLKEALLKRYDHTEEGFRKLFHSSRAEKGESPQQYYNRLECYLEKWRTMANIKKTYEDVTAFIVREQFLESCNEEMAIFVREKKPKSSKEFIEVAETFLSAHGGEVGTKRGSNTRSQRKEEDKKTSKSQTPFKPISERICYSCNKTGHLAKDCVNVQKPDDRTCYLCNKKGHIARDCQEHPSKKKHSAAAMEIEQGASKKISENNDDQPVCAVHCCSCKDKMSCSALSVGDYAVDLNSDEMDHPYPMCTGMNVHTSKGFVNQVPVTTMRDNGCGGVVVKQSLVQEDQYTGRFRCCYLIDGSMQRHPTAVVKLDSPYFTGEQEAVVMPNPLFGAIIGNIPGARRAEEPKEDWKPERRQDVQSCGAVTTRLQAKTDKESLKPLKVPNATNICSDKESLQQEQKDDPSLERVWEKAKEKDPARVTKASESWFEVRNGLLYRYHKNLKKAGHPTTKQLVVPKGRRNDVLKIAHDSILSGHLGVQRTTDRILTRFYWPGMHGDIVRYVRSCDRCQRTEPRGKIPKASLEEMPVIDTPFKRVAVDIIGPINPMSERKNRFILTVVDYATRYPEAVALPSIETERVAEALFEIYTRVGFPFEMLSDRGSNFTSDMMKEINRLVSVRQLTTTPYHPICNGLCERFNGTLKQILKRLCNEKPRDWDRYLSAVLFAYRGVPQESLRFSPFELLYGHTVRGPMDILHNIWTKEVEEDEIKTTYGYVLDLRERLEKTCEIAHQCLNEARQKYKRRYDRRARDRQFKVGDKVLVLLTDDSNKLLMQWKGPYEIVERVGRNDYRLQMKDKQTLFHVNMLKQYHERVDAEAVCAFDFMDDGAIWDIVAAAVIEPGDDDTTVQDEELIEVPSVEGQETFKDVRYGQELNDKELREAEELIAEFADILTDKPGSTDLYQHKIELTTDVPIRQKPYPLPYATRQVVEEEVSKMLEAGIIEESDSPYNSPIVLVKKKDNTVRFCIDFRALNRITIFDAEPMPVAEDIFAKLAGDMYFSKLDLAKGYWQIPLRPEDMMKTAFSTPSGHYHFKKMPFGLVNAGASFNRLMRKVLRGLDQAENYVDDVLEHTETWPSHLEGLRDVLQRIRKAKMTIRPTKCEIGCKRLSFVGHELKEGQLSPQHGKVEEVQKAPAPKTKRQVRSFIGVVGYYQMYIPNFSIIAVPLTNLVKKGEPNYVTWGPEQDEAFRTLKSKLLEEPVLRLPDFSRPFVVQTDASDYGIGAALMQEYEGILHPVAYASKKLLSREQSYSVIEKECLALVWAIKRFEKYLHGVEFILETDHQPLAYLNTAKMSNSRLMRWALFLQNYKFHIKAIRGSENVVADYLSRAY